MRNVAILSGSSNKPLAQKIAKLLEIKLGKIEIEYFPNNEKRIRVVEDVDGKTVYIVQSTILKSDEYIVELAFIADAVKRQKPKKIVAIMPWFGYAPQDKVFRQGEPLSSKVIIKMLESSPIDEFVVFDIHSELVLKMFTKKVTHLSAMPIFIDYFKDKLKNTWCSTALDHGALHRASAFSEALKLPLAKFDKSRDRKSGEVTFQKLKGDVRGKKVITFDDYVSSGSTTLMSADYLKKEGAHECVYCITHLVVFPTIKRIEKSRIDRMYITDSINIPKEYKSKKVKFVSIAPLLAKFITKNV